MIDKRLFPSAETLPQTAQEWFDNAWQHAVVRRAPKCEKYLGSTSSAATVCLYRHTTETGRLNACLIGVSIPDSVFPCDFDFGISIGVSGLFTHWLHLPNPESPDGFLSQLQLTHDRAPNDDYHQSIQFGLQRLAERFNLQCPELVLTDYSNPQIQTP
jgi:hypothetical protein